MISGENDRIEGVVLYNMEEKKDDRGGMAFIQLIHNLQE